VQFLHERFHIRNGFMHVVIDWRSEVLSLLFGAAGNENMEIQANTGGDDANPSRKGGWRLWLLVLLFPIPFSPWWLTIICLAMFCSLVYLFSREESRRV
jgi:hypothetical protein